MSEFLTLPPRRKVTRSPAVIAVYPCFQAAGDQVLVDRSGAGNGAAFGAALITANNAWATPNRCTLADNNAGSQAGAPFLSAAQLGLNLNTDSFIITGYYNNTNTTASHPIFGFGEITGAASAANGFILRSNPSGGIANPQVCYGTAGVTQLGTASGVNVGTGADIHVGLAYDGTTKRLWTLLDGQINAASSGLTGWDVSTYVAQMGAANGGTALGNLVFGGTPRANPLQQQVWACSLWGWQVSKRTGPLPANLAALVSRLKRSPTQELSTMEWA